VRLLFLEDLGGVDRLPSSVALAAAARRRSREWRSLLGRIPLLQPRRIIHPRLSNLHLLCPTTTTTSRGPKPTSRSSPRRQRTRSSPRLSGTNHQLIITLCHRKLVNRIIRRARFILRWLLRAGGEGGGRGVREGRFDRDRWTLLGRAGGAGETASDSWSDRGRGRGGRGEEAGGRDFCEQVAWRGRRCGGTRGGGGGSTLSCLWFRWEGRRSRGWSCSCLCCYWRRRRGSRERVTTRSGGV